MTMEQKFPAVNTRRRYDSSGRRERARQTRGQIIDAARELYLTGGYAATTVAAIAAAARVSAETIYKGFGGKPGLVRAIVERGLAGEGPEPAEQRSDHIRATRARPPQDPRRLGRLHYRDRPPGRPDPHPGWSTPSLVETRFSPDALVWVTIVFHGTAAWRNHGLIIFPLCFIEHLSSCAVQLSRPAWRAAPARPAPGGWASPRRAPRIAPRVPRAGQG